VFSFAPQARGAPGSHLRVGFMSAPGQLLAVVAGKMIACFRGLRASRTEFHLIAHERVLMAPSNYSNPSILRKFSWKVNATATRDCAHQDSGYRPLLAPLHFSIHLCTATKLLI
jgi:hypothetical protein